MIPFNVPPYFGPEDRYVQEAIHNHKISGDGAFTKRCHAILEEMTGSQKVLLTTSCSSALELAAILCDIKPGDEVIMPSYTFSSTANAFALRGATIVFVDVDPKTMNVDPACIADAVTKRTKAIVPMHYAGVCCDMNAIRTIARDAKPVHCGGRGAGCGCLLSRRGARGRCPISAATASMKPKISAWAKAARR